MPSGPTGVSITIHSHHEPVAAFAAAVLRIHAASGRIDIPQEFSRRAAPGACRPHVVKPTVASETLMDGMNPRVGSNDVLDAVPAPAERAGIRYVLSGITGVSRWERCLRGSVYHVHSPAALFPVGLFLSGKVLSHPFRTLRIRSGWRGSTGLLRLIHLYGVGDRLMIPIGIYWYPVR
jgi:hypothetical protein